MRKMNLLLVPLVLLAAGCSAPTVERQPSAEKASSMEKRLRDFDFKSTSEILEKDISAGKNTFVSPFVLRQALSLVANGAHGQTAEQILGVMNLKTNELDELNQYNEKFVAMMAAKVAEYNKGDYEKSAPFNAVFANSVWYKGDIVVEKSFQSVLDSVYKASFSELKGTPKAGADAINEWAAKGTNNLVTKIIEKEVIADPDFKMLLASLVYVKGSWTKKFVLEEKQAPFNNFGKDANVQFMERSEMSMYFDNDEFTAVDVPIAGNIASFAIVMPKKAKSLKDFNAQRATVFRSEFWETLDNSVQRQSVSLRMPKFEISFSARLNDYLKKMGMVVPFDQGKADFAGITKSKPLHISYVREDAKLKVNELGFEAAAIVSIAMATRSAPMRGIDVNIDKPFFIAIRDTRTKSLLFLGSVAELH